MKIIDISMPLHNETPVYGNKPIKKIQLTKDFTFQQHGYEESHISMNLHNGTHIDAPLHMMEQGATTDAYPLTSFIGPATVYDMMHVNHCITRDDLINLTIKAGDFILFKTRNSTENVFNPQFVYLGQDAAAFLAEKGVRGVGIDALGIERGQPSHATHLTLMKAGIIILEGLRLHHVTQGPYQLIALPLSIVHVDAAPVRAVLIQIDNEKLFK